MDVEVGIVVAPNVVAVEPVQEKVLMILKE